MVGTATTESLIDRFGRVHRALRISVTDLCNIRCQYCMPAEGAMFLAQHRLLPFTAIERFVRALAPLGIRKLRITGGEPLMRPQLSELIARLAAVPGVEEIALTTNGMLLAEQLPKLVAAGLQRVNVSLDTLRESAFKELSRREGLDKVLAGIAATQAFPQLRVRLNALVLRDVNLDDVVPLVEFARQRQLPIRFIEFMPLDAEQAWSEQRMVSGAELRERLSREFGPLQGVRCDASQPSRDYRFTDAAGTVGFIDSVSQPFCSGCDRFRLTADGRLRNCLFGHEEWDVGGLLRSEADDARIIELVRDALLKKHAAHGISQPEFKQPERAMYRIGG